MTEQTTSTELAINDPEFERKLRAMAGQFVGGSDNFIPKLSINKSPEDVKTKKDLPVGAFTVNTKTHGRVFAARKAPVQFRLFAKRYGYSKFDATVDNGPGKQKGATTSRSVQLPDFKRGSEYISDDGSYKCGKAAIPEGVKNPKVTTRIFFYGTVSFKGTTVEGTEVEIVNEPVFFTQQGRSFMSVDNYFKDFSKDGRRFFDHALTLTPEYTPSENGGFYNIKMEFTDLNTRLEFDQAAYKTLQTFFDYINANNKAIEAKFNQALAAKDVGSTTGDDVVEGGDLNDDFIDEEPEED